MKNKLKQSQNQKDEEDNMLKSKSLFKKRKNVKQNEELDNTEGDGKEEPSKKHIKKVCSDKDDYKPGMLSNILQKKKYGSVILPWESSFTKDQPTEKIFRDDAENEQKPKPKINPLFDLSKRGEENVASSSKHSFMIVVGNLPKDVTISNLKKLFRKCGHIQGKIKIRKEGPKQKYALIKFSTLKGSEIALKMNGKAFEGHILKVRVFSDSQKLTSDPEKSVFVGNLDRNVTDDDLRNTFEKCGNIVSVTVVRDYGYVNFKTAESVSEALKLDGTSLNDRDIRVTRFKSSVGSSSDSVTLKRKFSPNTKLSRSEDGNKQNDNGNAPGKTQNMTSDKKKINEKPKDQLNSNKEKEHVNDPGNGKKKIGNKKKLQKVQA